MVAIAKWLGSISECHCTLSRPMELRKPLMAPSFVGEQQREDDRDGDRSDDEGEKHSHAPEGLGADVGVEHAGDGEREDDLRHGRDHEDAEGVAHGDPELLVGQLEHEVVETDVVAFAADEVPVVHGDIRRVEQGEESRDRKGDEERGDVEIGGELHVPLAEAVPE